MQRLEEAYREQGAEAGPRRRRDHALRQPGDRADRPEPPGDRVRRLPSQDVRGRADHHQAGGLREAARDHRRHPHGGDRGAGPGGPDRAVHDREHDPDRGLLARQRDRDHAAGGRQRLVHPLAVHPGGDPVRPHRRGRHHHPGGGGLGADQADDGAASSRCRPRSAPSSWPTLSAVILGVGLGVGAIGSWISVRSNLSSAT